MAKTVLLTGSNGFVGSHITDILLREGYNVRAMVRTTSDLRWLDNKPVELVYAGLQDPSALRQAAEGVDAVIHNAGVTSAGHRYLYHFHNAEGTRNLLEAVVDAAPDISRFVLISSQAAGGPTVGQEPRRESDPPRPITAYGESKLLAEIHVQRFADRLPVTIIRPPALYGPRDRAFLPLFKFAARGLLPLFGEYREFSLTHVQDLARQVYVQLENEAAVGEVFHAAPFDPVTFAEFGETIARVVGTSVRRVRIPDALLKYVYPALYHLLRLLRARPPFQPDKVPDMLVKRWTISGAKARERLGFEGHLPLLAGVGQTAEWYRWKGWLQTQRDRRRERNGPVIKQRLVGEEPRLYDPTCDLCGLAFDGEVKTRKHYEDGDFVIVDCLICREPMAVLKEHRPEFTDRERERLIGLFGELFGDDRHADFEQRRIPEHAHVHYRRAPHSLPWQRRPE